MPKTTTPPESFEAILAPHAGYHQAGGFWRCACLHTYEQIATPASDPGNEQPDMIAARHTQHLAEILIKAGAELAAPDPRARLRERAAAARREPEILRDGSIIVPDSR